MRKVKAIPTYNCFLKKGLCYLCLLTFFVLAHFNAKAQQYKPKWFDHLANQSAGYAQVVDIVVDKQNNIYVTGAFSDTVNFNPMGDTAKYLQTNNQSGALFVAKYKQDGTLIWAESVQSDTVIANITYPTRPIALTVDKNNNISITGYFLGPVIDADPGPGVYKVHGTGEAGFLIHLDNNGNFLWADNIGDYSYDGGVQVTSDSQGNVITTSTYGAPITIGDSTYYGVPNYFHGLISKYDPAGNVLWSVNIANNVQNVQEISGCRVDSHDNIVVSGLFDGPVNFNPLGTPYIVTASAFYQSFIAKYSPSGILIWFNTAITGNRLPAEGLSNSLVSIDQQDNIYFGISFVQFITFSSSLTINTKGLEDVCFAKYSPAGVLQYAKTIGGPSPPNSSSYALCYKIANDNSNNIYVAGTFSGVVNFDPNAGTHNLSHNGGDLFVAEYDPAGDYIDAFTVSEGNCDKTAAFGVAVDSDNNLDVVGQFCSVASFDPSGCTADSADANSYNLNAYMIQYGPSAIANNIITPPAVSIFCTSGASPAAITGSLPAGGDGKYTYQWQSSADSVNFVNISGATAQNYTPTALSATTYFQRIVVTSNNCTPPVTSNVATLIIIITQPLAAPVVSVNTTTASSVIFTWTALPGATGYQVSTDGGQTYSAPTLALSDTVSGLQPGQSATIIVRTTGTNICQLSTASVAATGQAISPTADVIYVPNAFTPNGDGRNDQEHVLGQNIKTIKFAIYDQWGELLFTSTSTQNGWDGTYKGTKEPVGVYVYNLEALMNDGTNVKKKGTITLLK